MCFLQHQFLVQVTRKRNLNTRVLEEVVEQPEERMDLHDGDPYCEYGSLPPEEAERCPLEQNRLRDMQSCAHRIRGDWTNNIDVQTVSRNDGPRTNEEEEDEDDEDKDEDEDEGIEVFLVPACVHVCMFACLLIMYACRLVYSCRKNFHPEFFQEQ